MKRKKFVLMFMLLLVIFMTGCQKKTYLVTFVDYDDTILVEVEVEEGKSVSAPTDLFREGYTFTGWDESLDNITQTSIIKATYQINVFTVDFYDYDNTLLKSQGVNYQGSATAPTNPTRTGYEFTGWSVDFTNITANLTVNAVYELNEYTIIFKDFDGTTLKEQTVSYGQSATAPEVPEREGYSFLEWSEDFSVITDNLTIDAMYEIYTCVVSFVDEDDAVLKIETVSYLESATAPVDPQKPGYIFSGWDKDYTSITSTLQVKATYTPIEYSLIYHANNSESVLSSTQWTTKEIFVADFYTDYFTWLQNHVEDIPELSLSGSTYSLTKNGATATWSDVTSLKTIDKYVFEKTLSNYIYAPIVRPSSDDQPVVPVVNNGYFLNSEPYRSKFIELDGYFLKALITSYSGYDRSYTPTSAGKIQIFFRFQQWVQGTTITGFTYFDQFSRYDVTTFGNVTLPENRTFTVEDTTALPNPTYSGVDFLGWYTHPNGKGAPVTSVEGISESIDLYAFWDTDAANNTLRYYDLDGSLLKMETIATGVTPTPPTISPKEGYVFTGWDKSLTSVVTNLSLTAVYSKIAYTLTYDDNEATLDIPVPEALTYYADENLTLEHITYDGYYFLGWYLNSACTTSITQTTTGNIRVYAKWVKVPASGETVGDGTLIAVIDDATIQVGLSANVYGSTTTGYIPCSELTYSSSDETIATVSPEGFVIGKSDGTITILIARGA
ncbi:MAG: InlB B-repeat-containing protein, partial [Bacilli bacterium]